MCFLIDLERFAVVDEVSGNMLLSTGPSLVARSERVGSGIALELASRSSDSTFAGKWHLVCFVTVIFILLRSFAILSMF